MLKGDYIMKDIDLFDWYKNIQGSNIFFAINGTISHSLLVEFGEMIKSRLFQIEEERQVIKKVFAIFVELAQNLMNYSSAKVKIVNTDKYVGSGIILLRENADCYEVISGNLVRNSKIDMIRSKCEYINSLNKTELKEYYKAEKRKPLNKETLSAGIGLIDIVRKANNPIKFMANQKDENLSFMELSIKIMK